MAARDLPRQFMWQLPEWARGVAAQPRRPRRAACSRAAAGLVSKLAAGVPSPGPFLRRELGPGPLDADGRSLRGELSTGTCALRNGGRTVWCGISGFTCVTTGLQGM